MSDGDGRRPLDGIFFDIDDTLYSTTAFVQEARRNSLVAMQQAGLDADLEFLQAELSEVLSESPANFANHYDQLLNRLPRRLYKGHNPAVIVAAAVVAYHETKARGLEAYEDVIEVLAKLAATNVVLGIITSGLAVKQAEKLVRLGVLEFLHPGAIFISEQIGINKPNPKLYLRAMSDLNLKPTRCMFVGDRPTADIDPPNSLGMFTVLVRRGGRHEGELGQTEPTHKIANFWDLWDVLQAQYEIRGQAPLRDAVAGGSPSGASDRGTPPAAPG